MASEVVRAKDRLGRYGEELAARFLAERGLVLLDRNWRSPDRAVRGELDVVASLGSVLIVCEVKTRSSVAYGLPAEAVAPAKQRKIRALAACWLELDERRWDSVRFDVVAIVRPRTGPAVIEHLAGAF